jgi:uncharacterized hydrophobic protein (TIGR00271 family)
MKAIDVLSAILSANRFTAKNLPDLENRLFFEGERLRPYLVRFIVLLFLSTIIATGGILTDSTATVIGAMIVAPLMTPIIATTAALVMGRLKRALYSALIVIGGIILVVFVSWLLSVVSLSIISFEANSQIAGRISPALPDLVVALAAGAAGAFAMSRDDVADSLPGVAIAIALVPPLCVVGISLSQAQWGAAFGSTLLFLTNLLSILLAGGAVFALLNLGQASIKGRELTRKAQRRVYLYIAVGVLLVTIPLSFTSYRVGREGLLETRIASITKEWLRASGSDLELVDVNVFGNNVEVMVNGFSEPPPRGTLGEELAVLIPNLDESTLLIVVSRELPIPKGADEG